MQIRKKSNCFLSRYYSNTLGSGFYPEILVLLWSMKQLFLLPKYQDSLFAHNMMACMYVIRQSGWRNSALHSINFIPVAREFFVPLSHNVFRAIVENFSMPFTKIENAFMDLKLTKLSVLKFMTSECNLFFKRAQLHAIKRNSPETIQQRYD
ncbi:hypothetical protein BDB01DRAFT_889811 [Pilobolus umbonatus]|nr:hypothetical protein BDB01DRAFT_889811 [Pilobolus umbonatus]